MKDGPNVKLNQSNFVGRSISLASLLNPLVTIHVFFCCMLLYVFKSNIDTNFQLNLTTQVFNYKFQTSMNVCRKEIAEELLF